MKEIKLSQLGEHGMYEYKDQIVSVSQIKQEIKNGTFINEVYEVSDDYIENILNQVWENHKNNIKADILRAKNTGEQVLIDINN